MSDGLSPTEKALVAHQKALLKILRLIETVPGIPAADLEDIRKELIEATDSLDH